MMKAQSNRIVIDSVVASFNLDELNPRFSASINVANKSKFAVTATDMFRQRYYANLCA